MLAAILAMAAGAVPASAHWSAHAKPRAAKHAAAVSEVAPADEYFGPQKISVLGVRTMLDRAQTRLDFGVGDDDATHRSLFLAEVTIRAWQAKYPNDYWLPRMYGKLQTLYTRMTGAAPQHRSAGIASLLLAQFPSSREARELRATALQAVSVAITPARAAVAPSLPPPLDTGILTPSISPELALTTSTTR
jgi:hypothetical protein